jgi:amino acid adenylation domain-containing protein
MDGSAQAAIRARCQHPTGRFVDFPADEIEQSIPDRFARQVALHAERPAVEDGRATLSYRELDALTARIAGAIRARSAAGAAQPVALLFEHEAVGIAAILGALRAGRCYVPLDPASPASRTGHILADSGAGLVVASRRSRERALALADSGPEVLDVDELGGALEAAPDARIDPAALASMYYTSGSTGRPKGVVETHRNRLVNARRNTRALRICAEDRLGLVYAMGFSGSVNTIYGALLNGACLCLHDLRAGGHAGMVRWLREAAITIYHSTPHVFRGLAEALGPEDAFPALRVILLASDSLYAGDVDVYRRRFPDACRLVNSWGATESPFFRPYFLDKALPVDGNAVPAIGPAVEEDEIRLVDAEGRPVARGETGEIVVTSRYLSPGYWGQDELTRARFRPAGDGERAYATGDLGRMLPDGSIAHLGRTDFQVKVRGYRVEPSEIEAALRELDGVRDAAVLGRADGRDDHRLVAYVVPERPGLGVAELRQALRGQLPDYLVPTRFVALDALPLTPNGKLDRLALPDPGRDRPALDTPFLAPRTPLEGALAAIWSDVLAVDAVGVGDDFLELGGDSLRAMEVVTRVRTRCGMDMPLAALFATPTVADMAMAVLQHAAAALPAADVERWLEGPSTS